MRKKNVVDVVVVDVNVVVVFVVVLVVVVGSVARWLGDMWVCTSR